MCQSNLESFLCELAASAVRLAPWSILAGAVLALAVALMIGGAS
jgi:hypothetical protein